MTPDDATDETAVRRALAQSGLVASDEEVATMAAGYGEYRTGIEALYAVPEARYASPALVFTATPTFVDWSG